MPLNSGISGEEFMNESESFKQIWEKGTSLFQSEQYTNALICFKEALKYGIDVYLLGDIAYCNYKLKNYFEAEKYFTLTENSLLNINGKVDELFSYNYAEFLFEYKKDYEKAYKYSQYYITGENYNFYQFELYLKLLLTLNKKEESIKLILNHYGKINEIINLSFIYANYAVKS